MKRNVLLTIVVLAGMALIFTSCAKLPEMEMTNAKAAVEAAKAAEADRYVPAEYRALQD